LAVFPAPNTTLYFDYLYTTALFGDDKIGLNISTMPAPPIIIEDIVISTKIAQCIVNKLFCWS
jgi:hypothetical protein